MFERFTDAGRRVVVVSQEEARTRWHDHIGTEHLLLGVARVGGDAAKVLALQNISLDDLRNDVEGVIDGGQREPGGHIPFTGAAKKALELSLRASLELGHSEIGPEHLLLGLIAEGEGVAARVLAGLGLDSATARQRVVEIKEG